MGIFFFFYGEIIIVIWCWVRVNLAWPKLSLGQGYVLMSDCDVLLTHNCDDCNPVWGCWCCRLLSQARAGHGTWLELCVQSALPGWGTMSDSLMKIPSKITTVEVATKPSHFLCSVCGSYCLKVQMCYILTYFSIYFSESLLRNLNIFANYIMSVY